MKKIGKEVLFLPTGDRNPRNGEGTFARLRDGRIMAAGREELDIAPLASKTYKLFNEDLAFGNAYLTLSFVTKAATDLVPLGFEQGFDQFKLEAPATEKIASGVGEPVMLEDEKFVRVISGDTVYSYDKRYGRIFSIVNGGKRPAKFIWVSNPPNF